MIRDMSRRLREAHQDPRNSDRALLASLAIASYASVTACGADIDVDPETVVGDLLAGIMYWCDEQKTNPNPEESIDFEAALDRARSHYREEIAYERGEELDTQ
jgi:hypothetical protein